MTRYLISFDAHAMDHIPAEDIPAVADASHGVAAYAVDPGNAQRLWDVSLELVRA